MGNDRPHLQPKSDTHLSDLELTRWAMVAYAARCARQIENFVLNSHLAEHHKNAILEAIMFAEEAAAAACANAAISDVIVTAVAAAVAVTKTASDAFPGTSCVHSAARAAAAAANAAIAEDPTDDVKCAISCAGFIELCLPFAVINRDFNHLHKLCQTSNWTDETPVPPTVFGELWPELVMSRPELKSQMSSFPFRPNFNWEDLVYGNGSGI